MKKSENKKVEKEKCHYCGFKFPKDDMIDQKGKWHCFLCEKNGKGKL